LHYVRVQLGIGPVIPVTRNVHLLLHNT